MEEQSGDWQKRYFVLNFYYTINFLLLLYLFTFNNELNEICRLLKQIVWY